MLGHLRRIYTMPDIIDTLDDFVEALEKNTPIECDQKGQWAHERSCHKITRLLTLNYYDRNQLVTIAKTFTKSLDNLEKTPVIFQNDMKITQPQYKKFLHYLNAYQKLETKLSKSQNPQIKQELNAIKQRIIALKYRIEAIHGGIDKKSSIDEIQLKYICLSASSWKSKQKLYPNNAKNLTERDMIKLHEACLYPEFMRLLLSDKSLQNLFFTWTIRDNNGSAQFIEFPATCARLRTCLLDKRVGRLLPHELDIVEDKLLNIQGHQKIICLPFFDGHAMKRVNILDESTYVTLNNERRMTIAEIFRIFSEKRNRPGNVEFFGTKGIMNWANYEYGSWNPRTESYDRIDLTKPDWWTQLPVFEELSKDEVEAKYQLSLKKGQWVRCLVATLEDLDFDMLRRHGYLETVIPQENDKYAVYPFGNYPLNYPTDAPSQARLVTQTVEGRIGYLEENVFKSNRQHITQSEPNTPDEGKRIMELIRQDVIASISGNHTFQLFVENCAQWSQKIVVAAEGKKAPNPFIMPVKEMRPTNRKLDWFVHTTPRTQSTILNCFRLFAYLDGKTINKDGKRVYKTATFPKKAEELVVHQPAYLKKQIEDGSLHGVITYGN